jgi:hypothetical protein
MSESVPETPPVTKTKKRKLSTKPTAPKRKKKEKLETPYQVVVLDIEGTTTPSFFHTFLT